MQTLAIKPMEMLDNKLTAFIDKNIDNTELKKILIETYLENKLYSSTINALFSEEKFVNMLTDKEKIFLIRGIDELYPKAFNEKEYFSEKIIDEIDNTIEVKIELPLEEIEINNMLIMNDSEFIGYITFKQLYDFYNNNLIIYNKETQRFPTYKKIGDQYISLPTVDEKSVMEMSDLIEANKLETSNITFGYLLKPSVIPQIDYDIQENNILCDLRANKLLIIDGFNRISSIINYCMKALAKGVNISNRKIAIKVVIGDKERLLRVVAQSFKRSETNKEYLKAITNDDYSRFVDKVIEQSDCLEKVATTFEECKFINAATTKEVIRKAIEYLDIQVNNKSVVMFESKSLAENLDILIDTLKDSGSYLDYYNMYLPYLIFAYKIDKNNNDMKYYEMFIDKIKECDIKELKLGLKNYNVNKLIEYFNVFEV